MIPGRATPQGTARYRNRFAASLSEDHFREVRGLLVSSVGIGTYLGEPTPEDDAAYEAAIREAVAGGINVIDTAINYRFQRSERSAGRALSALVAEGALSRDEFIVASKAGFIPFDDAYPRDPQRWIKETFLDPGLAAPAEIVAGCHCIAPGYIEHQFEASRRNLGLETIDVYYVHNPETQLKAVDRAAFLARLGKAFEILEEKAREGKLGVYGTATWDGYRRPGGDADHLSLAEVLDAARGAARAVGTEEHHLGAVQLPLNLAMPEALLTPTQVHPLSPGNPVPALAAASAAGLMVMASASILQGHLAAKLPAELAERIPGGTTRAHKAIQWVRSAPGVATALVGMRSPGHVRENLALGAIPRMSREEFRAFLGVRH